MSIPNTRLANENHPIAPGAPPINRQPEGTVNAANRAGGEIPMKSVAPNVYREAAPSPAKPYRDLSD